MKKEITGYICGVISGYGSAALISKKRNDIEKFKLVRNEFSDLLDYVEDIPGEDIQLTANRKLGDLNKMLEATCDLLIAQNCELMREIKTLKDTQI